MENQEVNIQESRWLVFLKESLLVLVLGLAIWLPRGYSLEKFVSTDEIPWLVRSANFYFALGQRDFNATFQNGTPGVTTMWVNTIAFLIENPEYRGFGQGYFDSFLTFERFADSQGIDSHAILITARSIMVVIHTLLLIFCYFLARKLLGFLPALAGILLIIFEPYFIGLTRLSHLDGLVGTLSLVGVLSFIIYAFKDQKFRYLFAASIATSAASLTKVSGFIILPGLGLILFLMFFFHYREFQNMSRQKFVGWIRKITIHMLLFSGIFLLFYFLIWPAMWNDPIGTIIEQFQYPGRFLPETSQVNNEQSDKYLVPYVDENNQIFQRP